MWWMEGEASGASTTCSSSCAQHNGVFPSSEPRLRFHLEVSFSSESICSLPQNSNLLHLGMYFELQPAIEAQRSGLL